MFNFTLKEHVTIEAVDRDNSIIHIRLRNEMVKEIMYFFESFIPLFRRTWVQIRVQRASSFPVVTPELLELRLDNLRLRKLLNKQGKIKAGVFHVS